MDDPLRRRAVPRRHSLHLADGGDSVGRRLLQMGDTRGTPDVELADGGVVRRGRAGLRPDGR